MGRPAGKTAVMTGIGPGNGRAISLTFACKGADLAPATLSMDALPRTVEDINAFGQRVAAVLGCDKKNK